MYVYGLTRDLGRMKKKRATLVGFELIGTYIDKERSGSSVKMCDIDDL